MSPSTLRNELVEGAYCTTDLPSPTSISPEPAFICTICWQDQPQGSKPKLLGTSARIVCHACWCAILDLSICWVCGECIVRGDEVVSLGWCFWHRGCFGCLFCKTKMKIPDQPYRKDLEENGGGNANRTETEDVVRRCIGVELEDVPLCGVCRVETAGEEKKQVLEKGLETVTRCDGGLSRDRLHMLDERSSNRPAEVTLKGKHSTLAPRRIKGSRTHEIESDLRRYINDGSADCIEEEESQSFMTDGAHSVKGTHSKTGSTSLELSQMSPRSEFAALDTPVQEILSYSDSETVNVGNDRLDQAYNDTQEDIYISIFNPLEEPAFRPSKTKPLPQWMRLLPNNVHRDCGTHEQIPRTRSLDSFRSLRELQTLLPISPVAAEAFPNPFEESDFEMRFDTAVSSPTAESTGSITPTATTYSTPAKTNSDFKSGLTDPSRHLTFVDVPKPIRNSKYEEDSSDDSDLDDDQYSQRRRSSHLCPNSPYTKISDLPVVPQSEVIHPSLNVFATGPRLKNDQFSPSPKTPMPEKSRAPSAYEKETVHASVGLARDHGLDPDTLFPHLPRASRFYSRTPLPFNRPAVVESEATRSLTSLLPPTPPTSPKKTDGHPQQTQLQSARSYAQLRSQGSFTPSREYLEQYQPIVTGQTNFSKYVAKEREPILEKIRRERRVRVQDEGDLEAAVVGTGRSRRKASRESAGMNARNNLHQELTRLFGGD